MQLQIVVSNNAVAERVVSALTERGHVSTADPAVPGRISTLLRDAADAPAVRRLAAMLDHPAAGLRATA